MNQITLPKSHKKNFFFQEKWQAGDWHFVCVHGMTNKAIPAAGDLTSQQPNKLM